MNFELGKTYIVNVTQKGIVPLMEFKENEWINKEYNIKFLTEEKRNEEFVNGGMLKKTFNISDEDIYVNSKKGKVEVLFDDGNSATFSLDWWNKEK